jgi:hypothetical protein
MADDLEQDGGTSDDLAAAARERTRRQVHSVFAAIPETPPRLCPHCGARERTRYEQCPACGMSYFVAPPRFSRRTRRALTLLAAALVLAAAGAFVVVITHEAAHTRSRQRAGAAAAIAAERQRLTREQTPHHGHTEVALPGPDAGASSRRDARRRMVADLRSAITADARARIARGELQSSGVRTTQCGPLDANQQTPDEDDLGRPLGRYSCSAVSQSTRSGAVTSSLGIPFVAVIDFRHGTFTWCKDNPVSPADLESQLAFVRLARECTAARGPAWGSGYLADPRKR